MWQLRVVRFEHPDGDTYEVHNVNIDTNTLDSEPVKLVGDSIEDLEDMLVLLERAIDRQCLNSFYFKNIKE
jgi:hypothetical protein